jgi:hypothetical protein
MKKAVESHTQRANKKQEESERLYAVIAWFDLRQTSLFNNNDAPVPNQVASTHR